MATAELVARFAEALAWPIMAAVAVILLRSPLATFLAQHPPSAVKAGPFELKWDRVAAETEKAAKAEFPASASVPQQRQVLEELTPAIKDAPLAAIQEAYRILERELREAVGPVEGEDTYKMGPVRLARLGASRKRLSAEIVQTVNGLSVMHNMAVHGRGPEITSDRAHEYVALVDAALYALRGT
jgi:hypothetical protein